MVNLVGIFEHLGHALTYKILTDDTKKIIHCSIVRSALDPGAANNRTKIETESEPHPYLRSRIDEISSSDSENGEKEQASLPLVYPEDLTGRTFLLPQADGQMQ